MHSEIRTLLSSTFGRLLDERHPISHARKTLPAHNDEQRSLWRELAEGGWLDAGSDDFQAEYGAGTLLMGQTAGRVLLTLPYAPTAFLAQPLLSQDPSLCRVMLAPASHPASLRCDLDGNGQGWIDDHGPSAQYLRLSRQDQGWRLARYDAALLEPIAGMDPTISLARLGGAPVAQAELSDAQALPALQRLLAFQSAQLLGAAGAALDLAIAYAKEREQFGRPIGQFQAVKHALVDAWIDLDSGGYAVTALLSSQTGMDTEGCALSARLTTAAARNAVKRAVQVHGGIGFSWEHDAQLYLKRVYRLAVDVERLATLMQR